MTEVITTLAAHADGSSLAACPGPDGQQGAWDRYDVHGLLRVHVESGSRSAPALGQMLEHFRGVGGAGPVIRVYGSSSAARGALDADRDAGTTCRGPEVEYGETSAYWRERDLFVGRDRHGWVLGSSRDVEPFFPAVLDHALLDRGCALVHAASVRAEGRGVLLAGWGGAGKTSALATLMAHRDARFLADDLSIVRADGSLLAFPKSMYIYPYHRPLYPHVFAHPPKPLLPPRLSRPTARVRQVVRPLVERSAALESLARRWTPEHMKLAPPVVFPDRAVGGHGTLTVTVHLERADVAEPVLLPCTDEWLAGRLTETLLAELSASACRLAVLLSAAGVASLTEWSAARSRVIRSALATSPGWRLLVPPGVDAADVGRIVREQLERADGGHG